MSKVAILMTMCLFAACAAPETPAVQPETDTTAVTNDTVAVADTLIMDTTAVDTAE